MLRAIRKYLPLILASWISLFLGLTSANAGDSHLLGKFGANEDWVTSLFVDEDGSSKCIALTTNPSDETFAVFMEDDGAISLHMVFEDLVVDAQKTLDVELKIGRLTWTLEEMIFTPDTNDRDTIASFDFPVKSRADEFLDDLTGSMIVTLHDVGDPEPFSIWFFDGYVEALAATRKCHSYITPQVSGKHRPRSRPQPRPASSFELKPGEKKA